jgi:hypothetical protein
VTLCAVEGSLLANMFRSDSNFAPPIEIDGGGGGGGEVFLDRNPISFGYILDYLRDGCRVMVDLPSNNNDEEALLQRLRTDADYFGLEGLVLYCDTKLSTIKNNNEREIAAKLVHEESVRTEKMKKKQLYMSSRYWLEIVSKAGSNIFVRELQSESYIFERTS